MNWETDCRVGGAPPEPWGLGTATLRPLQLTGAAGASAVVIRFRCSKKGRSAPPETPPLSRKPRKALALFPVASSPVP